MCTMDNKNHFSSYLEAKTTFPAMPGINHRYWRGKSL